MEKLIGWFHKYLTQVSIRLILLAAMVITLVFYTLLMIMRPVFRESLGTDNVIRSEECATVLNDRAISVFEPHVAQLDIPRIDITNNGMRVYLQLLKNLPYVAVAYWLTPNEIKMSIPPANNRKWLCDSLWKQKNLFIYKRTNEGNPIDRVGFRCFRAEGQSRCFMCLAFDTLGTRTAFQPPLRTTKENFGTFIVIEFDHDSIQQAIKQKMDFAIKHEDFFGIWTFEHVQRGFGILNLRDSTDTLWWYGTRKYRSVNEWYVKVSNSSRRNGFFRTEAYRETYSENPENLTKTDSKLRAFPIGLTLSTVFTLTALILIGFLYSKTRSLWLARETALDYLAHSLRTPISRIRIRGEILEQRRVESESEEREMQHGIVDECDRLNRTVMNSLLIVRGEINKSNLELINLNEVIEETEQSWEPVLRASRIQFAVKKPAAGTIGMFHRDLLLVMLDNLLDNSFRAISKRRQSEINDAPMEIVLSMELTSTQQAKISVVDTGTGFDTNQVRKLLNVRFLQTSLMNPDPGIGVGLRLVKEIVDRHKGRINVSNTPEGGAKMEITLPLSNQ